MPRTKRPFTTTPSAYNASRVNSPQIQTRFHGRSRCRSYPDAGIHTGHNRALGNVFVGATDHTSAYHCSNLRQGKPKRPIKIAATTRLTDDGQRGTFIYLSASSITYSAKPTCNRALMLTQQPQENSTTSNPTALLFQFDQFAQTKATKWGSQIFLLP